MAQNNVTEEQGESYGQILNSSAVIGGSTAINIAIGVVRTKLMALMLGPAGFGLFGLYGSIAYLARTVGGLGIHSSGVREIAYAVGTNDAEKTARTTIALRRVTIALGVLGSFVLSALAKPVSVFTFGTDARTWSVVLLAAAVFTQILSDGQSALIQGMRKVADLARIAVFGAILGTVSSVAFVYVWHERGIVPSVICVALMSLVVSWWYSRKIKVVPTRMNRSDFLNELRSLLKLGITFMASTLAAVGSAYLIRVIVLRKLGYASTGLYQSAWTLGGLYVSFILDAMGTDFYPRLTAMSDDNIAATRLVNEQVQVGLLLACPGVLATLTLAPLVIPLFYSAKFDAAAGFLRWLAVGAIVQVATWPMSYLIAAKNRKKIYFLCELAWSVASVGLAWVFIPLTGLDGAGIAFLLAGVIYGVLLFPIVRYLAGFSWSHFTLRLGALAAGGIGLTLLDLRYLPLGWATGIGLFMTVAACLISLRTLVSLLPSGRVPPKLQYLLQKLRLIPASASGPNL